MPTHNMFSKEVSEKKFVISTIGIKAFKDRFSATSYKEQALNELSLRLHLEELLEASKQEINRLLTLTEELKDKVSEKA